MRKTSLKHHKFPSQKPKPVCLCYLDFLAKIPIFTLEMGCIIHRSVLGQVWGYKTSDRVSIQFGFFSGTVSHHKENPGHQESPKVSSLVLKAQETCACRVPLLSPGETSVCSRQFVLPLACLLFAFVSPESCVLTVCSPHLG